MKERFPGSFVWKLTYSQEQPRCDYSGSYKLSRDALPSQSSKSTRVRFSIMDLGRSYSCWAGDNEKMHWQNPSHLHITHLSTEHIHIHLSAASLPPTYVCCILQSIFTRASNFSAQASSTTMGDPTQDIIDQSHPPLPIPCPVPTTLHTTRSRSKFSPPGATPTNGPKLIKTIIYFVLSAKATSAVPSPGGLEQHTNYSEPLQGFTQSLPVRNQTAMPQTTGYHADMT